MQNNPQTAREGLLLLRSKIDGIYCVAANRQTREQYEASLERIMSAVDQYVSDERETAQRTLLQGLVDNAPSDQHKEAQNDAYYFDIGWEATKVLGELNRQQTERLLTRSPDQTEGGGAL